MKKIVSLIILLLVLSIFTSGTYAIDMFLNSDSPNDIAVVENVDIVNSVSDGEYNQVASSSNAVDDSLASGVIQESSSSSRVTTTESNSSDEGLSTTDIINIILISVGIVIILLAVAILIKIN